MRFTNKLISAISTLMAWIWVLIVTLAAVLIPATAVGVCVYIILNIFGGIV